MEPQEVFGVIVRTVGLLGALYGLWCAAFGVAQLLRPQENEEYTARNYLTGGIFWAVAGTVLLLVAPTLAAIAYR